MRFAYQPLPGEPDQLCNLVAAGIIDEYLRRDPEARIKCLVNGGHEALFVSGEVLSSQDFDVGQLVTRILGVNGLFQGIEPFVALESVPSSLVEKFRMPSTDAVLATGYATREHASLSPKIVCVARDLAKMLYDKRTSDPEWFWMGTSGSVTVQSDTKPIDQIIIQVDHGTQDLESVRQQIKKELEKWPEVQGARIKINPLGPRERTDLEFSMGHSHSAIFSYGSALPIYLQADADWHNARVAGQMLARWLAREVLKQSEAKAILVRLNYGPGDLEPEAIEIKDEKGSDLSHLAKGVDLHLERATAKWRRPGLISDMVKWGLTDPNMPWED